MLEEPAKREKIGSKSSSIDVEDKSMPTPPISSVDRKISKQQLSAIIEHNGSEEYCWEMDDAGKISNPQETECKQLVVFVPQDPNDVNNVDEDTSSETEEIQIEALTGREKEQMDFSEYVQDDTVVSNQSENFDLQIMRVVVSDDESLNQR
ncbi:OLC1v1036094C1 [Oldenlandia corymbosa var. corymbosa]|uniref:OLC1v1036094C1 n=1 Tax=Oldenlandia corymbosa var. corymbosa TaxID=529605 RepID=A0AAV1CUJ5_OLDCO|nr:OLC1v1036094C1 [Oldenlandia corymbosa var. corymbosa]